MLTMTRLALLVFAASAALPALAQQPSADAKGLVATAPGKAATARVVKISASVEAIDAANRVLTLKGPQGNMETLEVGPEVKNFAQIKVGDLVVVRYYEALSLELKKGGKAPRERTESTEASKAQPGQRPAAGAEHVIKATADVIAVDTKHHIVTLRGPKQTVNLNVRDPEQLKLIKVGDQVEATYTAAVAISVEPTEKSAPKK
jgi:Cu/Ag efflux protein CusF